MNVENEKKKIRITRHILESETSFIPLNNTGQENITESNRKEPKPENNHSCIIYNSLGTLIYVRQCFVWLRQMWRIGLERTEEKKTSPTRCRS